MTRQRFLIRALALLAVVLMAAPLLADTAALWKQKCAPCHGENGTGETTMGKKLAVRNLASAEVQKQSDAALLAIITKGKNKMPAYGGKIADADLKALLAHIRTFGPKK
jgi:mono/diheme cytochrome c family protein